MVAIAAVANMNAQKQDINNTMKTEDLTLVEEWDKTFQKIVHGDKAHSFYFGKDVFAKLKGANKEFVVIPGASHTDLYDRKDIIPFDRIADFFNKNF